MNITRKKAVEVELENEYGCKMEGDFTSEELEKFKKAGWKEREEKCKIEDKRMVCELPVYKIKGDFYFRDIRLGEYRNIKNPSDRIPINDISLDDLQKPTEEDRKEVFK